MTVATRLHQLRSNIRGGSMIDVQLRKSPIELKDTSPLSTLEGDPFAFSSISYPRDVTMDMQNGHYMLFYINVQNRTKYEMISQDTGKAVGNTVIKSVPIPGYEFLSPVEVVTEESGNLTSSGMFDNIRKGGKGTIISSDGVDLRKGRKAKTGFSSVLPTTTRITDSIAIYLPPDVQSTTSAEYLGSEMGIVGLAAAGAVNFVKAMARNDFAAASNELMGSAKGIAMEAAKRMGSEFAGALAGVDPEAITGFANKAFGQATNPYMEVLFQNVDLRTFSYNFTFSPRNTAERDDVQKIIKMFRFHMLPELKGSNSRYMTLPSTFDIHYMYQYGEDKAKENPFYSKIATCVLKNVEVDYTPGAVKSFKDGSPTQITMALSFQETEMLTKQHVDKGY